MVAQLGTAEAGDYGFEHIFTYFEQSRSGIDTSRLKADHPEIVEQYKTTTKHRSLRVTKNRRIIDDFQHSNTNEIDNQGPVQLAEDAGGHPIASAITLDTGTIAKDCADRHEQVAQAAGVHD